MTKLRLGARQGSPRSLGAAVCRPGLKPKSEFLPALLHPHLREGFLKNLGYTHSCCFYILLIILGDAACGLEG